jgi:hypothetical protein
MHSQLDRRMLTRVEYERVILKQAAVYAACFDTLALFTAQRTACISVDV